MASLPEFPWRTMAPKVWQCMGEWLHAILPLCHPRVSVLAAVGMGVGSFGLAILLGWLTAPPRVPAPPPPLTGIELQQLLNTLQTMLAAPTLVTHTPDTPAPWTLKEAQVALHFVVEHSTLLGGTPLYRLVPVDTALPTRPEQVQTLRLRLTP